MATLTLTKTRLSEGIWEGILTVEAAGNFQPEIAVSHNGETEVEVEVAEDREAGNWRVRLPIPMRLIADGVQVFVITDKRSGAVLNSFAVLAGETLDDDLRGEIELLRAELDMLKRAFRRHCLETMG